MKGVKKQKLEKKGYGKKVVGWRLGGEKGGEEECKRVQVLGERKKKGVKRSVSPVLKGGN